MWIAISNAIGSRQPVGGGPGPSPGYTPPLDTYTGAAAAYSVRKLSSSYSGPCIEAHRLSDGATQDIGFDADGLIDTAAIIAFANGGGTPKTPEVRVRTWYDQSGNGFDGVQSTTANQPQIYNGIAVITENGKPALEFDGSNDRLDAGDNGDTTGNLCIFGVGQSNRTGVHFGPLLAKAAAAGVPNRWSASLRRSIYKDSTGAGPTLDMTQDYTQQLASYIYLGGSSATIYQDGSQDVTASLSGSAGDNSYHLLVGGYGDSTGTGGVYQTHDGTIQEVVYYNADKSSDRTGIETNINSYFSIY